MAKKLDLKKIKKELEELETLEEKKNYLENILKEIKEEKLKKQVEKLLEEIKELIDETSVKDTIEKTFKTEIPAPELPVAPEKLEVPAITTVPEIESEAKREEPSLLETYVTPPAPSEEPIQPGQAIDIYRTHVDYIPKMGRDAIHEVVTKYLRAEGIRPEEFLRSPGLQRQAAEKAQELLGETTDLYTIQGQVQYEAQKATHPDFSWERDSEGWIKYKTLKGVAPELVEEE